MSLDPRLTPARGDIAASHLKGQVEATRFLDGARFQVAKSHAALRARPEAGAEQVNQALFGETFMAYDQSNGWAWGQLEADGYVGWMALAALSNTVVAPSHRVSALRTFVFDRPDLKSAPLMALSINAKFAAGESQKTFLRAEGSGWIFAGHASPLAQVEPDFVAVAERFVGAPYLWGGRDSIGLDCSGLVQMSLEAAGVKVLRDSDMQAASIGEIIQPGPDHANLRRGDFVFWAGHVAIMLDAVRLIHANAWHMATEIEPLSEAVVRIAKVAGEVKRVRRLAL
jgi:cell wall-associated NlpC family hydrolase